MTKLEVGQYYWFDYCKSEGAYEWVIGKIVEGYLDQVFCVQFCGSDEIHSIPFCYRELIEEPNDY